MFPMPYTEDLRLTFARSGGPGGQHANKVSTKVVLHLPLDRAHWLP